MNWIALNKIEQLDEIKQDAKPIIIFKHSTRCPVSTMARRNVELEAVLVPENVPTYFLDLIKFRDISNQIAEKWDVKHESPQVLLIHGETCIYHASHNDISIAEIVRKINELTA